MATTRVRIGCEGATRTIEFSEDSTVADAIRAAAPEPADPRAYILVQKQSFLAPETVLSSLKLKKSKSLDCIARFAESDVSFTRECGAREEYTRVVLDGGSPASDAVAAACKAFGIRAPAKEYALFAGEEILEAEKPLGVKAGRSLVLRRRFFDLDTPADPETDFTRVSEFVENGFFMCKRHIAIAMAANLAQATLGDYSSFAVGNGRCLKALLPPQWRHERHLRHALVRAYRSLVGTGAAAAKAAFVATARTIPSFGMTMYFVQEWKAKGLTEVLGVSRSKIVRFMPDGHTVIDARPLDDVMLAKTRGEDGDYSYDGHEARAGHVVVYYGRRAPSYIAWSTKGAAIVSMMQGYISILAQRREAAEAAAKASEATAIRATSIATTSAPAAEAAEAEAEAGSEPAEQSPMGAEPEFKMPTAATSVRGAMRERFFWESAGSCCEATDM